MHNRPGVYAIVNTRTGVQYIGSSVSIATRLYDHIYKLRKGTHCNAHLQRAFEKHGEDCFEFVVLEWCPREETRMVEQQHLDAHDFHSLYNINTDATGTLHLIHTEQTRRKISEANRGRRRTEQEKQHLSRTLRGVPKSEGFGAKIRAIKQGCTVSAETKRKLSAAHKGKKLTKEHCDKISAINKGRKKPDHVRNNLAAGRETQVRRRVASLEERIKKEHIEEGLRCTDSMNGLMAWLNVPKGGSSAKRIWEKIHIYKLDASHLKLRSKQP